MKRERVKTLILCILISMSIFFTQRIWFYSPARILESSAFNIEKQGAAIIEARDKVVMPQNIVLSFGGVSGNNYFTVMSSEINEAWNKTKVILDSYFKEESNVTPSTYEKYKEVTGLKSVEVIFGRDIPSVLVASLFDSLDNKIVGNIKEIKKIVIPANNRGSIFIQGKEGFFEVKLENYENRDLIDYIDQFRQNQVIKYYPLFDHVGNSVIMPLNYDVYVPKIFSESALDVNREEEILEITKTFFNENFNFVKTIKETSGAVQFMYGYGEKGVRINNRGRLEYNEEIGSASSTEVLSAFDTGLKFILNNGKLPEGAYLNEVKSIENGRNKGYFFGFGYRLEGFSVKNVGMDMSHPIEIEVYGNKVRSYRTFIRKAMNLPHIITMDVILLPHQIIENNIEMLKRDYQQASRETIEITQEEILKNIKAINMVYFDSVELTIFQRLVPAWKIELGNNVYYFDGYNGRLLSRGFLQ